MEVNRTRRSRSTTATGDEAGGGAGRVTVINGDRLTGPVDASEAVSIPTSRAETEFNEFFRRHYRELGRLAYTLTGSHADADDVVGEGLASVWENWERVQAADHPRAYVRRVIVNLSANRVKQIVRQRQTVGLIGPIARWFHNGPDIGASVDLQAAIVALPAGRRACVVLRHVFDLPEEEVARTLGISVGTVKSQTSKGLAQLRRALGETQPVPEGSAGSRGGNRRHER